MRSQATSPLRGTVLIMRFVAEAIFSKKCKSIDLMVFHRGLTRFGRSGNDKTPWATMGVLRQHWRFPWLFPKVEPQNIWATLMSNNGRVSATMEGKQLMSNNGDGWTTMEPRRVPKACIEVGQLECRVLCRVRASSPASVSSIL